jgi:hypothetical protein
MRRGIAVNWTAVVIVALVLAAGPVAESAIS